MRLQGNACLGYYPTHIREVFRMLGCIGYPYCDEKLDQPAYQAIEEGGYREFEYNFGYGNITILDPFCGEGEWLETFKKFSSKPDNITTVGIEVEKNRFDKVKADYKFHSSFEDSELPKESVNVCIFNCPYGSSDSDNGQIRNVRHYLQMLLDKEYLTKDCAMIMVISGKDFENILDILDAQFNVELFYKVEPEEFEKWGQYVIYCKRSEYIRSSPASLKELRQEISNKLSNGVEFDAQMYQDLKYFVGGTDEFGPQYDRMVKGQKVKDNYSKHDKLWDWVQSSNASLSEDFELVLPDTPDAGRISTLLSTGLVNGQIDVTIDGVDASHIVSGGVRSIERIEQEKEQLADGKTATKTTVTRFSRPYLNILVKQDGKLAIKEIISEQ